MTEKFKIRLDCKKKKQVRKIQKIIQTTLQKKLKYKKYKKGSFSCCWSSAASSVARSSGRTSLLCSSSSSPATASPRSSCPPEGPSWNSPLRQWAPPRSCCAWSPPWISSRESTTATAARCTGSSWGISGRPFAWRRRRRRRRRGCRWAMTSRARRRRASCSRRCDGRPVWRNSEKVRKTNCLKCLLVLMI